MHIEVLVSSLRLSCITWQKIEKERENLCLRLHTTRMSENLQDKSKSISSPHEAPFNIYGVSELLRY